MSPSCNLKIIDGQLKLTLLCPPRRLSISSWPRYSTVSNTCYSNSSLSLSHCIHEYLLVPVPNLWWTERRFKNSFRSLTTHFSTHYQNQWLNPACQEQWPHQADKWLPVKLCSVHLHSKSVGVRSYCNEDVTEFIGSCRSVIFRTFRTCSHNCGWLPTLASLNCYPTLSPPSPPSTAVATPLLATPPTDTISPLSL